MANERMGELASEIGAILAEDAVYPLERTLLYAQVGENWVGPDVYKDGGATIMYQWASKKLTYPLLELWEESDADNRWSEIEYWIENGRFDIRFVFPEEIDADEDDNERRDKIVKRYFGDRPIVYPAFPTGDDILNFNLQSGIFDRRKPRGNWNATVTFIVEAACPHPPLPTPGPFASATGSRPRASSPFWR